eukprot:CAMPEP_0206048210 /NCGR_PEP_ID=MMETSP1466-20131121/23461_1 /ASSEMBLY_ACC=CAM_ASM_001126 /TAXON_ID=44452 /ORGANISM="Pavlova gyrans, Strain CCMP608" /LENGTH=321 /DNA_ID=CAMNT_0053423253 /DNA_START=299 /DNA_END=1262 /DNA_ORIENTATION=+
MWAPPTADASDAALVLVVAGGAPMADGPLHESRREEGRLPPCGARHEALAHLLNRCGAAQEAGKEPAHASARHLDELHDLGVLLASRQVALHEEVFESPEAGALHATHELHVFVGEFEGRRLKAHVAARAVGDQEAKVDVHDVALHVQEDVAVVPVLDLQQVGDDRPRRAALREEREGALEGPAMLRAVHGFKDLEQRAPALALLHRVHGDGVGHHLHQPAVGRRGHDAAGVQLQRQARLVEAGLDHADELHRKLLLAQVVVRLDDHGHQGPALDHAVGGGGGDAALALVPRLAEDAQAVEAQLRRLLRGQSGATAVAPGR